MQELPEGSKVVVVGLGRTGIGVARLLRAQGHAVLLLESRQGPEQLAAAAPLEVEGIAVQLGVPLALESLGDPPPAAAVVSPGIAWNHPELERMRQSGITVLGELTLAARATAEVPWIGITGTNGKTTVTHLVQHLLSQGGLRAPLCGNVGVSAAEVALGCLDPKGSRPDWLVVELSSYQIEQSPELSPAIGLWTTLTPDHLERHGSLDHYRAIKRRLLENADVRILNADDADLRSRAASWESAEWITARPISELPKTIRPCLWIEAGVVHGPGGPLFIAEALAMPGDHNRQNLLMATAVALRAGLEASVIEAGLRSFPGVPHRLERIRVKQGVSWYNDSKATNYDAAEVALKALEGPLVVLAGGEAKQGDARAWIQQLQCQAKALVLYGNAREEFAALLADGGYSGEVHSCEGLAEGVPVAEALAESKGCRGVLLSPACASFDQYRDFEARGDHFRELVVGLAPLE
ncbi:MAG: UDP-N-acetylmuramoyl-L-alanine--D-glutamate ligase [Synechococcaceae cyanobacterium ELA182]